MELNITELGDIRDSQFAIPENMFPNLENKIIMNENINTNKKTVQFFNDAKPMIQTIPKSEAKIVRPHVPVQRQQMSYEDILSKMGMVVDNGKLLLINNRQTMQNTKTNKNIQPKQTNQNIQPNRNIQPTPIYVHENPAVPNNSYIYNKYFKNEVQQNNQPRRPMSAIELRDMLIKDIIQKHRVKQMKNTKLIMPTSNINFSRSSANMNKLFSFSNR
jgi:hypothetical protein